jgi:branched-chain amino acid transport system ATP-binding protein
MSLEIRNLTKKYGANVAMNDVSMTFEPGRIYAIIGPNGAGKSTFVNMVAGSYSVTSGSVVLDGRRIDTLPKHAISLAGVARTYQNIRLFDRMTVEDNLDVCLYPREKGSTWRSLFAWRAAARRERERLAHCHAVLARFALEDKAKEQAGMLPYGRQRMLEIARALVRDPRVLILDEPAAGLNEAETADLRQRLEALKEQDRIIIVIEHDMDLVMAVSDHVYVLHNGALLFGGTPAEVQANPEVQEAYLGTENELDEIRKLAGDRKARRGLRTQEDPVRD